MLNAYLLYIGGVNAISNCALHWLKTMHNIYLAFKDLIRASSFKSTLIICTKTLGIYFFTNLSDC